MNRRRSQANRVEHTGILVEREDLLVHSVLENLNDLGMRPVELVSGGLTHDGHEAARFHYANCLPEDAHGVSEVMPVQSSDIEKTESFSHGLISSGYVQGVAKIRGKVKILLDLDCVLSQGDLQQLM